MGRVVPAAAEDTLQSATVQVAPAMGPQAAANIWWSFATLGLALPAETIDALRSATVRAAAAMTPQAAANTLWAVGVQAVQGLRARNDWALEHDKAISI